MNETYNLELLFANEEGKNRKITIRRPLDSLTEVEVAPVMQAIVDSDLFDDDGLDHYAIASSARYVRKTVDEIFFAVSYYYKISTLSSYVLSLACCYLI